MARSVDGLMTAYRRLMMRKAALAAVLAATAFSITACATLQGAAIGGVGGAAVAAATGKSVEKGAAIGGVAGGVVGTVAH
jgi:predicted small secreted protein